MQKDTREISENEGNNLVLKHATSLMLQVVPILANLNPSWQLLFLTANGMINAWGDFGQSRVNELATFISEHREEFLSEALESDKFKAVFLSVLELHMKETSERRRQLLKSYLLNVGKNIHSDFDEHTKVISTMNVISFQELETLLLFRSGGIIEQWKRSRVGAENMSFSYGSIAGAIWETTSNNDPLRILFPMQGPRDKMNQVLLSLGNKDLLYTMNADNFGSGEEVKVRNITEFGKKFLDFITT